jgi:hypothetical protein
VDVDLSNARIFGVALALFSTVLLGVGIHHLVATGTCSSTGFSGNFGPVPTCPSGTGWWFAFVFGGVIGGLAGSMMAGNFALIFASIFGAIGFGALSLVLDSHVASATKVFGGVFGGCFAIVGVVAAAAVLKGALGALGGGSSGSGPRRVSAVGSAFGTPQAGPSGGGDPILSAYNASRATDMPARPTPRPMPGLQAAQPAATANTVDELEKLADLHKRGVVSDAEFATAKAKLLGAS